MGRSGHRGLFPFPVPKVADPVRVEEQVNRRVLRRLEARCHVDEWVRDIIVSLNSLFMGSDDMGNFEGNMQPTLSQRICTSQMRRAVLDVGKLPADVSGQGALSELRVHSNYMGDPVALAPLEIDLVSLPPAGSKAAEMDLVFGEEARNYTHRITSKILAEGDVRVLKAELGLKKPYVDPALRGSPKLYADFCRKLDASGLIEFRETFTEQVGAFTVWKKSGKQRLVIDARLANLHFGVPEKVSLATGATFANIEVDSGPPLEVGGVDIADAFYHLELIPELRGFFALPGVRAGDVGCSMVNGKKINETSKIYPCLKVVPMGWTHALWLCQAAHEHIVNLCPRVDSRLRCRDKRPVPEVKDYIHTQYVDNFVALSQKPGRARELAEEIGVKLNERGLPTHEVEAGKGIETLGWLFSASHPTVTVTQKRLWKLRLGTKELLKVGKASGKTIEKLVGHYTFAGLLQRGFLSCFQATYVFIRKHYETEVPLWPEVSRELFWAASLICLVRRDLSSPWSTRVHATDASTWGRGIVSTQRNVDDIKALGRRCDRWRFTVEEEKNVLRNEFTEVADAIDAETLEIKPEAQLDQVGIGDTLEVPLNFIGEDWGKVDGSAWDRQEAIPILEGRCIVWLLQHLARSQKNLNKKHLVLSDSMSVVLALSKGRSSAGAMNRICRQVAALELATGMHVHTRWLPSELNPADLPSRAQAIGDFSLEEGLNKFRENHAEAARKGRSRGWRTSALQFHQGWCRNEVGTWSLRREEFGRSPPGDGAGTGGRQSDCHETTKSSRASSPAWKQSRSNGHGQEDLPGTSFSGCSQGKELREVLPDVQALVSGERPQAQEAGGTGSRSGQLPQLHVLRGQGPGGWHHSGCGSEVLQGEHQQGDDSPEDHGSIERVPEVGTGSRKGASPVAHAMRDRERHVGELQRRGFVVADDLGNMCQARGDHEAEEGGLGATESGMSSLGGDPQCIPCPRHQKEAGRHGPRHQEASEVHVKGWGVRRSHPDRPTVPEGLRDLGAKLCLQAQARGVALHLRHAQGNGEVQQNPGEAQLCDFGDQLHVPDPSRQCVIRCADRTEKPQRDPKARPVDDPKVGEKVHQRRKSVADLRQPEHGTEGRSILLRTLACKDFRRWKEVKPHFNQIGLELFSGCGHFSRAVRRRLKKVWCAEVDILHGPQFDMTLPRYQRHVIELLVSGEVAYVWLGTPCNSWSRARRNDGKGPGPLRDDNDFLLGLPGLSDKDQQKVQIGNILMKFTAKIFRICLQRGIPVALENPHTSRLWLTSPIKHLLQHRHVSWGYTDFCQDGMPFRKRTRLMWANVDLRYALRPCQGPRGVCSRTGERHQQLLGTQGGQFLTLLAQPYPHALCRRLAVAFEHAVMSQVAADLAVFFLGQEPETFSAVD